MWASPPVRSMSTLVVGGPSGVPQRTKQEPGASSIPSTRITSSWCEYAWWTYIPNSGPLPGHTRRLCTWGLGSLQNLNPNFHLSSHCGMSPWSREPHQHDCWGPRAPAIYGAGHLPARHWGDSIPKRPTSLALGAPPSAKVEDSVKPVATSSQVSPLAAMPDYTEPIDQTPKVVCTPTTLPTKTLGTNTAALPEEVISLQKETNKVMGCLLITRSSLDAHWRKQVSDFKMGPSSQWGHWGY